jgi:AraC-like DNA-binding protein
MRFREATRSGRSQVLGAGWLRGKTQVVEPRDYAVYALVFLSAGGGWYHDALHGRQAVAAGDVLCLFPGLRHSYGPVRPGDWSECWVGFAGPLFTQLEAEGLLDRRRPVLHPGADHDLIGRFDAVVSAIDRDGGISDPLLLARVHLLCAEVVDRADRRGGNDRILAGILAGILAELAAELGRPIDLAALARRHGMGYDAMRRAVRRATGTTPGRWRNLRRIERAKEMLVDGLDLDRIAQELGWCDRSFLTRQFTAIVGRPPAAWRRAFLGDEGRRL